MKRRKYNRYEIRAKNLIKYLMKKGILTKFLEELEKSENRHFKLDINDPSSRFYHLYNHKGDKDMQLKSLMMLGSIGCAFAWSTSIYGVNFWSSHSRLEYRQLKQYENLLEDIGYYNKKEDKS